MLNIESFMEWLNDKIDNLKYISPVNLFKQGESSAMIMVRQKLCEMDAHDHDIEDELGVICQRYCRYPEAYPEHERDRMMDEKCNDCMITRLTK